MSVPRQLIPLLLLAGLPLLAAAQSPQGGPGMGRGADRAMAMRAEREAAPPPRSERPGREVGTYATDARQQQRSLSEAVRWVQRSTGGQILGAELVPYEGRSITRVKYMDDRGRVRYMDHPGSGDGSRRSRRADHE